jgi:peroxiredoxin
MVAASSPAFAALQPGADAPRFTAPAALGGKDLTFSLREALAKGPVVVYFYPSAYTGGCNLQARGFAQKIDQFAAAGATVVGVSLDGIERLRAFSADPEYCAGRLPVASDADGAITRSYGLQITEPKPGAKDTRGEEIGHGYAQRTTFVLTPDGKVAATIGGVSATENVEQTLAAVQALRRPGA